MKLPMPVKVFNYKFSFLNRTGPFILYISHRMIFGSLDFSWSLSVLSKLLNYSIKSFIVFSYNPLMLTGSIIIPSLSFLVLKMCMFTFLLFFYPHQSDDRFLNYNGLLKLASLSFFFSVFYVMDLSLSFLLFCLFGLYFAHLIT